MGKKISISQINSAATTPAAEAAPVMAPQPVRPDVKKISLADIDTVAKSNTPISTNEAFLDPAPLSQNTPPEPPVESNEKPSRLDYYLSAAKKSITGTALSFLSFMQENMSPEFQVDPITGNVIGVKGQENTKPKEYKEAVDEWKKMRQEDAKWIAEYDPNKLDELAAFGIGMTSDFWVFGGGGKIASAGLKGISKIPMVSRIGTTAQLSKASKIVYKDLLKSGVKEQAAREAVKSGMTKIGQNAEMLIKAGNQSGGALGTFGAASDIVQQINEGKSLDEIDFQQSLKRGGKDYLLGTLVGYISGGGAIANKAAERAMLMGKTTFPKVAAKVGIGTSAFAGENAAFLYGGQMLEDKEHRAPVKSEDWLMSIMQLGVMKYGPHKIGEIVKESYGDVKRLKGYTNLVNAEFTPEELNSFRPGMTQEQLIKDVYDGKIITKEFYENKNIPISAKYKITAGLEGENIKDVDLISSAEKITTANIDNETFNVSSFDKDGNLLETKNFATEAEATAESVAAISTIKDIKFKKKVQALTTEEEQELHTHLVKKGNVDGIEDQKLRDAIVTDPLVRTPEQVGIVSDVESFIDKQQLKKQKEREKALKDKTNQAGPDKGASGDKSIVGDEGKADGKTDADPLTPFEKLGIKEPLVDEKGKDLIDGKPKFGDVGGTRIILSGGDKNTATIERIFTPEESRGKGGASKALDEITRVADENGTTLRLRVNPEEGGGMDASQLESWYSRKGFEKTDGLDMVRKPLYVERLKNNPTETTKASPLDATVPKPVNKKGIRDVYVAGREVFGLNRSQALAQAIVIDRMVGRIAKNAGKSKSDIYGEIEFKKSTLEELSPRGKMLYQAIGESANLSILTEFNLKIARGLERQGKDPLTIKLATGWERGVDKKWRLEIPDNVKFNSAWDELPVRKSVNLRDVIDAPELFKAYPELERVLIKKDSPLFDLMNSTQAWFNPEANEIAINPRAKNPLGSLLHEIQHWVQEKEGFAKGGNMESALKYLSPEELKSTTNSIVEVLAKRVTDLSKSINGLREIELLLEDNANYTLLYDLSKKILRARDNEANTYKNIKEEYKAKGSEENPFDDIRLKEAKDEWERAMREIQVSLESLLGRKASIQERVDVSFMAKTPIGAKIAQLQKELDKDTQTAKKINNDLPKEELIKYILKYDKSNASYKAYQRIAGEVEARNVTKRANLSPGERRKSLLSETEDVAREEQMILFQGLNKKRAAVQFLEDGKAIVHALTNPNVSSPVHEMSHIYEKYMPEAERKTVLKWTGDKEWTVDTSEKFAKGFEKYLAEGKSPSRQLEKVFTRFKEWLTDIYDGITGSEIDVELNAPMRKLYNSMLKKEPTSIVTLFGLFETKSSGKELNNPENKKSIEDHIKSFLEEVQSATTDGLAKGLALRLLTEKQRELTAEINKVKKNIADVEKKAERIEVDGKTYRVRKDGDKYFIQQISSEPISYGKVKGSRRNVTEGSELHNKVRDAYEAEVAPQREKIIADETKRLEDKFFGEIEAEVQKFVSERNQENPEPVKKFSKEEPKTPTPPIEPGKKTREPLPSAGKKVVVDESTALKTQLKQEARAALGAMKFTEKNFKETSKKVIERLKEAVGKKLITPGQYRAILNRLGRVTSSENVDRKGNKISKKRMDKLMNYVDKTIDGAEYNLLLQEAKKIQKSVLKGTRFDKSKYGTGTQAARLFKKIDLPSLTAKELRQFIANGKLIGTNKKAPNIAAVEKAIEMFYTEPAEKIKKDPMSVKEIDDLIESLDAGEIYTPAEYVAFSRKLSAIRRATAELDSKGELSPEEKASIEAQVGNIYKKGEKVFGEKEQELEAFKEGYVDEIKKKTINPETSFSIDKLPEAMKEYASMLQKMKAAELRELSISDIESYETVFENIRNGHTTPELARLYVEMQGRRVGSGIASSFRRISGSGRWKIIRKFDMTQRKSAIVQRIFNRNVSEKTNLTNLLKATDMPFLASTLGDFAKYNEISTSGIKVSKAVQKAHAHTSYVRDESSSVFSNLMKAHRNRHKREAAAKFATMLGVEKMWQTVEGFDKISNPKESSFLEQVFNPELEGTRIRDDAGRKNRRKDYDKDSQIWDAFKGLAEEIGAYKEINGVRTFDLEKIEAELRKDKSIAEIIDHYQKVFSEMEGYANVAGYFAGRSFLPKKNYFPLQGKEIHDRKIELEDLQKEITTGPIEPIRLQAGSTHESKNVIQWIELDPFKVLNKHTTDVLRSYYVHPELQVFKYAVEKAGKEVSAENVEKFKDSRDIKMLSEVLVDNMLDNLKLYYNTYEVKSGRTKTQRAIDKIYGSGKKTKLAVPAKLAAEMTSNIMRGGISMADVPIDPFKGNPEYYHELMRDYVGERFLSSYGEETRGKYFRSKVMSASENAADWMITAADNFVGKRMFAHLFNKSFKEVSGFEFDAKRYSESYEYRVENWEAIDKAGAFTMNRIQELFNDKTPLSRAQLTTFFGGLVKADRNNFFTKTFDFLQSFNRREHANLVNNARKIYYGTEEGRAQAYRDFAAVITTNFMYNVIRTAFGIGFNKMMFDLLSKDDESDEAIKEMEKFLDWEYYKQKAANSAQSLVFGGTTSSYNWIAKGLMYGIDKSEILDRETAADVKQKMFDYFYIQALPKTGSPERVISSAYPVSYIAEDLFRMGNDVAAIVNAMSEGGATDEQIWKAIDLANTIAAYKMPNPLSPMLAPQIRDKLKELAAEEKAKKVKKGSPMVEPAKKGEEATPGFEKKNKNDKNKNSPNFDKY